MKASWIIIGAITFLIALGSALIKPRDISWTKRLSRPKWLFFEPAIPLIWTFIFACGSASAAIVWDKDPGSFTTWVIMSFYLIVEIVTVAYIPATLRLRSLTVGTVLGILGVIFGILVTLTVWPISGWAALLLVPYLIWTPIGTYTTGQMIDLNPDAT
ncbi:TspO/MBR family protein [Microseira wollei]|uniref:TspO and MBR like protein n=1 Tax=Microseira wollei NIES-4236 TaxID=2530354 RepID=A0AAV3XD19_9CYAN|nr:TspO/MBR family protein [Microseira wollei]GET40802.1 TspO and MBR like protein [Microseira wollei NIES-4236]